MQLLFECKLNLNSNVIARFGFHRPLNVLTARDLSIQQLNISTCFTRETKHNNTKNDKNKISHHLTNDKKFLIRTNRIRIFAHLFLTFYKQTKKINFIFF